MSDERTCENCKWYLAKTKACTNSDSDNAAGAVKKDDTMTMESVLETYMRDIASRIERAAKMIDAAKAKHDDDLENDTYEGSDGL